MASRSAGTRLEGRAALVARGRGRGDLAHWAIARPRLIALALVLVLAAASWALWPVPTLRLEHRTTGRVLALLPVEQGAFLRLSYVHSVYDRPGVEEFVVESGGLRLVRLTSPSAAVLEYYARPEPIVRDGEGYAIHVVACARGTACDPPAPLRRLSLLASIEGRRTLTYGGRELPLYQLAAPDGRIVLTVESAPRMALLGLGAL